MATRQLLPQIPAGTHPGPCALDPSGDLLLVANEESADLAVIRVRTQSLITMIPVGMRPSSIAIKLFLVARQFAAQCVKRQAEALAASRSQAKERLNASQPFNDEPPPLWKPLPPPPWNPPPPPWNPPPPPPWKPPPSTAVEAASTLRSVTAVEAATTLEPSTSVEA